MVSAPVGGQDLCLLRAELSVCLDNAECQFILTAMDGEQTSHSAPPLGNPSVGLRAVLALRRLTERVEAEQVANARAQGWSWQQIADGLGMTRQSVHAKYGGSRS